MTARKPPEQRKKRGRPRKQIDWAAVERLAMIQCTQQEIASFIGVDINTLRQHSEFLTIYNKGQDAGKMSLRRKQWAALERGKTTMLIWLGKQYLGQRDRHDVEHGGEVTSKVITVPMAESLGDWEQAATQAQKRLREEVRH